MTPELEDINLACVECRNDFVFSVHEQKFFREKGLNNPPKRCHNCRIVLRAQRKGAEAPQTTEVVCAECGTPCVVPFTPKGHTPVLCMPCKQSRRLGKFVGNMAVQPGDSST